VSKVERKSKFYLYIQQRFGSVKIGFVYSAPSAGAREDWKMARKIKGAAAFE
jgi:hypothetical protein